MCSLPEASAAKFHRLELKTPRSCSLSVLRPESRAPGVSRGGSSEETVLQASVLEAGGVQ